MFRKYTVGTVHYHPDPDPGTPPLPPSPDAEAIARARYDADVAKAETARLKQQLDEATSKVPSEEQRAKWAELEAKEQQAEEERAKKAGEFDAWRTSINERHTKELDEKRQQAENSRAAQEAMERELNEKLIGLEFSGATAWFGPTGKTVLLPDIAQSYFAKQVSVEVVPPVNGGSPERRVIVKDLHGVVIVDPKTGKPMAFAQAIGEVIEAHPKKAQMLRGSGKVGSGSAGGDHALEGRDLNHLKASDFSNPEVRDAVREQLQAPGGLRVGPGFDAIEKAKRERAAGRKP